MHQPINELHRPRFIPDVTGFDPDLMYVECKHCSRPVLWNKGRTSEILQDVDIVRVELDSSCMILTHGCPRCTPGVTKFRLQVIRADEVYAEEQQTQLIAHA
ncbi:hypothetical protein LN040_14210 [Desulfovibrio subterraneus]|jgi:hypothetical protein|uniref:Uncharacterized protein n=1 Tax=Desulfovibrio subterraneus TaxID=2718620 RepID=A0A7J0BG11_9BACT|nr:hypothetical protein [Desulfovibrio subterraneus]WBF66862.1 hypothetical protein LN040_14210 [Desulfovibrio subterraneus]GFM32586.1 hypothetical protein DSM101010T_09510 [Desulfovibrio subterraneus]